MAADGLVGLEYGLRSADRARVAGARLDARRWLLYWLLLGPGLLAMLGENDGPSMISYAATGATYGLGIFLPFVLVTFSMAAVCQEMCARVGAATGRGYGELVLRRFGPLWGWFGAADLALTNLVTLVAEFVAIRIGMAYFHLGAWLAAAFGLLLVVFSSSTRRYRRWERLALGLALFNGLFLVAAILTKPSLASVGHAVADLPSLSGNSLNTVLLLVASTVGATVTPWMVYFQQSATVDKGMTARDVGHGRVDVVLGGILAALFGSGALVAGAALAGRHASSVEGLVGTGFPGALREISGGWVGSLFALGLIEAGAVAILTISASTAYAAGECVGLSHSFNSAPSRAKLFYGCNIGAAAIAAGVVLIPGAPLLQIALNANVLATVLLPVALVFLIMLANDRFLMGSYVNKRSTNVIAAVIVAFVGLCGTAYGIDAFLSATRLFGGTST